MYREFFVGAPWGALENIVPLRIRLLIVCLETCSTQYLARAHIGKQFGDTNEILLFI